MRRNFFIAVLCGFGVQTTSPAAAPYCSAFLDPEAMPSRYARLAPVLSDRTTGWIFTQDQLNSSYKLKSRTAALLAEVARSFEGRDMRLAILMPPPRPLAAGQQVLEETAGGLQVPDLAKTRGSFAGMTAQVRAMGIIMPDLSQLVSPAESAAFYFARDTHWTPMGAALSARALALELNPAADPQLPEPAAQDYVEKGSLTRMAAKTCGTSLEAEKAPLAVLPGAQADLLGSAGSGPRTVLAGSSFSNRLKRDAYRVGDALSAYLETAVANYSVSGGGAIGAIEGMASSGLLQQGAFDLVIWELPYNEGLNKESALRQLLGALELTGAEAAGQAAVLSPDRPLKFTAGDRLPRVVRLDGLPEGVERLKVEIRYGSRKPSVVKLQRKGQVPADLRGGPWALSLAALPSDDVTSIRLKN